jgi:ribosomal protein S6
MAKNQHVIPLYGNWAVRGEGNERPTSIHKTQAEAINAGREIAKNQRSELIIHRADGRIRERASYGNDPFPPKAPRKVLFPDAPKVTDPEKIRSAFREVLLNQRNVYEVIFIVDPTVGDTEVQRLAEALQKIITGKGGNIIKTEVMGKRQLAYEINHQKEGTYVLLEVESTGAEIAELERRMRGNNQILRYMTVRVDEHRHRAKLLRDRSVRKSAGRKASGTGAGSAIVVTDTEDAAA